jgi:PDZ domain-containing secreted protein
MKGLFIATLLLVLLGPATDIVAGEGRGYIGVTVLGLNNQGDEARQNGVFIGTVYAGSGAEAVGLEEDDRILTLNGMTIEAVDDMDVVLNASQPGEIVQVGVLRGGTEQTFDVVLGGKPAGAGSFFMQKHLSDAGKWVIEMDGGAPRMGVNLQPLTAQLADYFDAPSGLLVTEVVEDSAAWKAGLQAGDVLLDIDGQDVTHQKDVQEILTRHEAGDVVDVTVQRRGQTDRFSLTLQEASHRESGEMTFNIALEGDSASQFEQQHQMQIEMAESGGGDWTVGDAITIWISTDDDADTIRARIEKLKQELHSLQQQLQHQEND